MTTLFGRRVLLRPLEAGDFPKWQEVRRRNIDWLTKWEPARLPGSPDVVEDAQAFSVRCSARQRERQIGSGYGFGIFVDGVFGGEINLNSIQRGPFQSAYVGYWIDEAMAGQGVDGLAPEVEEAFQIMNERGDQQVDHGLPGDVVDQRFVGEAIDKREHVSH